MLPSYIENPNPDLYKSNNYVVLDFETTNLDFGNPNLEANRIVHTCWNVVRDGERVKKSIRGSEFDLQELIEDISGADFIVAHNAKFELGWLVRCGYDLASKPIFCTQIAEYVIAGNRRWPLSLEACLKRRKLGGKESVVSRMIKAKVCPSEIPATWLEEYCVVDVDQCERLFLDQRRRLFAHGLQAVFYCRCLLTPVLADLESIGMCFDKERVRTLLETALAEMAALDVEITQFSGDINLNSSDQLAEFLFKTMKFRIPRNHVGQEFRTPGGKPQVNQDAISALQARTKKQEAFLELYKRKAKLETRLTTLRKMWACCEEADGMLYGQFNQTVTQTHRLSSSGRVYKIQFQNFDNDLKPVFKARYDGWLFGEADEAQLEYRTAVDLAQDLAGLEDIRRDADSHSITASFLFDGYEELDKESTERKKLRRSAKAHTFKPLYGGQSGTPRQRTYYQFFKDKHEQITEMQEGWKETVHRDKQLRVASGLVFYWPNTRYTSTGYLVNTANICNYPVQNLATAEVVPLALVCMWHRKRAQNLRSLLVNTVHDSVIMEVHPDEKEEMADLSRQALERDPIVLLRKLYGYEFSTPLEAEVEYNTHWGTNKDWEAEYLHA